jgi:flagellar hook-basal body complex protein FliE
MKNIGSIPANIIPAAKAESAPAAQKSTRSFGDMLAGAIDEVGKAQNNANEAIEKLQTGESRNIHEVMIAMEKSGISMRLMVTMRNKIVEAYQEVMRMQI